MKNGGKRAFISGLVVAVIGLGLMSANGQIPTLEERILNSSLNPSNNTWKAQNLRIWPMPEATKGLVGCYRYDFELSAKPRQATITFQTGTSRQLHWIIVNGAVVAEPMLPKLRGAIRTLDLTPYLKRGHNVFALKSDDVQPGHGLHLLAEGMVFGEDGSVLRLMTDKTWRGGWNLPAGWEQPETDPQSLPLAEVMPRHPGRTGCLPFYIGPIQVDPVGMSQPLFDAEKGVELAVTLMNGAVCGDEQKSGNIEHRTSNPERRTNTEIKYEIMNEESRQAVTNGVVALKPKGKLDLAGTLKVGPLPAGAYRVRLIMTAGTNEVDRRDYEVVSVGVIQQRLVEGTSYEDGMDLKPVWTVDCTQEPEPGMFITGGVRDVDVQTKVAEGPAGKYRALVEARAQAFFAYRFKVKKLYAPHLIVIEWPDDVPRSIFVQVYEPSTMVPDGFKVKGYGWQRGETAFISVDDQPRLSGKMQKLHIIYWPAEEDASIHLFNASDGAAAGLQPAAASRISVYEIANDLPALRIADAGDRMIGYHSERANILPSTCYAGPLGAWFYYSLAGLNHPEFYRNWYTTTENLIKRMRFSGQNMYLLGHFMYDGALYPSRKFMFEQNANAYIGGDATRDYAGIILRMFARNGMSMVSGIEYVHTASILAESSNTLEQVVRDGAPTLYSINKNAKLSTLHGIGGWSGLNYFHPKVQADLLTLVDELTDLYKEYPAWKGVSFILSRNFGPMMACGAGAMDDSLDWGYEDYTIALFQKETGIKIPPFDSAQGGPATGPDPDRFAKRYDWLMANAKQKWIDWRCAQFTRLFCKMRDTLVKGRPDLKLYLLNFEPMSGTKQAMDFNGRYNDPACMSQAVKTFGFDAETLRKEPGMVVSYSYATPGTLHALVAPNKVWWQLLHGSTWQGLFANDGQGGAYVWSGIIHYGVGFPEGKWIFAAAGTRQGYFWPRYMSDGFVNVLIRSNPAWMPHTWMDVTDSCGRLHDLRLFSRAYRSLPNGKYERLAGNGLDLNIWVESTKKKSVEYAYAANPHWWDLDEVTLDFAPGVKVHDLIKDVPAALKDGKWTFKLGPYEVQSFRVEEGQSGSASAVVGAKVKIGKEPGAVVSQGVNEATEVVARARAKEAELKNFPGWPPDMARVLAEADNLAALAQSKAADLSGLPAWPKVQALSGEIAEIRALQARGDISRAYEIAMSHYFAWEQAEVAAEVLDAMPFLVLGPFGDPKDTDVQAPNKPLVSQFKGMDEPYIGESTSNVFAPQLPKTFKVDLTRTYRVYPGKEITWQRMVKARHLSFDEAGCGSASPSWMIAYAYTEIYSPVVRDCAFYWGSDHSGVRAWINGSSFAGRPGFVGEAREAAPDQSFMCIRLNEGWNSVLFKFIQRKGSRVYLRLVTFGDPATKRQVFPLRDVRYRVQQVQ